MTTYAERLAIVDPRLHNMVPRDVPDLLAASSAIMQAALSSVRPQDSRMLRSAAAAAEYWRQIAATVLTLQPGLYNVHNQYLRYTPNGNVSPANLGYSYRNTTFHIDLDGDVSECCEQGGGCCRIDDLPVGALKHLAALVAAASALSPIVEKAPDSAMPSAAVPM